MIKLSTIQDAIKDRVQVNKDSDKYEQLVHLVAESLSSIDIDSLRTTPAKLKFMDDILNKIQSR